MTTANGPKQENAGRSPLESPETTSSRSVLETIDEPVAASAFVLTSGRRIEAEARPDGDFLRVSAPGGDVLLSVLVTPRGPVLRFEAADLELSAMHKVEIACETFELRAKQGVVLETDGSLTEHVQGDVTRQTGGRARQVARDIDLVAEPGTIGIRANDDVDVRGERVRLNCESAPMARTWDEFISRLSQDS